MTLEWNRPEHVADEHCHAYDASNREAEPTFDVDGFLRSSGAGTAVAAYQPREIIFSQGDDSDSVMYLQEGAVKLLVLSRSGQEAVVAMLEAGAFFGESALVGDPVRHEAATAMTAAHRADHSETADDSPAPRTA